MGYQITNGTIYKRTKDEHYETGRKSNPVMYWYKKPTIKNYRFTFADGSVYWPKVLCNDKTHGFKDELNKLYLNEQCTVLANVTRKQRIQECKKKGLI
ncbi:TPA: hypothetical protein ACGW3F_003169 [Bacillus paranthracis]